MFLLHHLHPLQADATGLRLLLTTALSFCSHMPGLMWTTGTDHSPRSLHTSAHGLG